MTLVHQTTTARFRTFTVDVAQVNNAPTLDALRVK